MIQMIFYNSTTPKSLQVHLVKSMSSCYATIIPTRYGFFACHILTANTAAKTTVDWCAAFSVSKSLISDRPTYFKNETLRLVSKSLQLPHHFTLPHFSRSNGAVERLRKELLRLCSSLILSFRWTLPSGLIFCRWFHSY